MVGGEIPLNPLSGRKGYQPLDHEEPKKVIAMPSSRAAGSSTPRPRARRRNPKYTDEAEGEHLLGGDTSADDTEFGDRLDVDAPPETQLSEDNPRGDASSVRTVSYTASEYMSISEF